MSKEAIIFEVSESSFEKYVIGNSDKVPVFVLFMNVWSQPSNQSIELFSQLAIEFAEQFVFAKVDVDENSQLVEQYDVVNVPTLKVIVDGKVVTTEEGCLSDDEARAILKSFGIVNETEELRLQARQSHIQGDTQQAILLLTQAIQKDSSNTNVAMDMVQIFIDVGELAQANALFNRLPDSAKKSETGVSLSGQLWVIEQASKTVGIQKLKETLLVNPDDYDARFDSAICELAVHNTQQALEHLFYIQINNANYKEGAAREMIVAVIDTITSSHPDMAQQYRTKLAGLLAV